MNASPNITLTDSAANKVRKLRVEEGDDSLMLVMSRGAVARGFRMALILQKT